MDFENIENKINMNSSLKNLIETEEEFKGFLEWRANVQWHYFCQLIERGFNEEQAIFLVGKLFNGMI